MRDTSLMAFVAIQPTGRIAKECYRFVKAYPDRTYNELAKISGLGESFRKRGSELERDGFIVCSGRRVCEVSGFVCHTWRVNV